MIFTRILIVLCGLLFTFNYDICSYYYDVDIQTAEWWNLRFKLYSLQWNLLGLAVFLNVDRITKMIIIPVLAIFMGDFKDRVLFDYTERHWSDWILVILSIILIGIIWRNGKSGGRDVESNP